MSVYSRNYIKILAIILPITVMGCGSSHHLSTGNSVGWYSMEEAQELAKKQHKKVLVYAEASWCVYCKKMKRDVFPRKMVMDSLQSYYYPVKIDIESEKHIIFNEEKISEQEFSRRNRIRATPTFLFVSSEGEILGTQPGFIRADTFSRLLAYVGKGAFRNQKFKAYLQKTNAE